MNKELNILEIVKEDILRILGEEKSKKILLESIKLEIKVSDTFISQAIKELERENLIQFKENIILLTKEGQKIAKNIIKKHLAIEDYFKRFKREEEAHKIAHILEHYISEEVIKNIKKLSTFKKKGIPLTKFGLHKKGLISNITFSDYGLFERIVSMGMFPGKEIRIMYKIPDGLVVNVNSKKFALGRNIAKEIQVLKHERT